MAAPKIPLALADPPRNEDISYLHSVFCQVGMPRRRHPEREFTRRNGAAWMVIQAGSIDDGAGRVLRDVPHGVMPRLLVAWICNEVVRRPRSLELDLAETPRELLRQLGLGGQAARYTSLRDGLHDLAAARFQLGFQSRTLNASPVHQLHTWGAPGGARLVVGRDFAADLQRHAVPLDQQALALLSGSALALDFYTWLAQRLCRLEKQLEMPWASLRAQLGQEYQGARAVDDFRGMARLAVQKVLEVYPGARVQVYSGGLVLERSPPPVARP